MRNVAFSVTLIFTYLLFRQYWKSATILEPIYGADTPGSLYDADVDEWNVTRLPTILDLIDEQGVRSIDCLCLFIGVTAH